VATDNALIVRCVLSFVCRRTCGGAERGPDTRLRGHRKCATGHWNPWRHGDAPRDLCAFGVDAEALCTVYRFVSVDRPAERHRVLRTQRLDVLIAMGAEGLVNGTMLTIAFALIPLVWLT
jgi:hypothetical protein